MGRKVLTKQTTGALCTLGCFHWPLCSHLLPSKGSPLPTLSCLSPGYAERGSEPHHCAPAGLSAPQHCGPLMAAAGTWL